MSNENDLLNEGVSVEDGDDAQKDKYLTFHLGDEEYGLHIGYVTEIVGIQAITAVPDMPDFVRGVINLRGQVIPVMDVRKRFKMPERDYDDRTCVVVVRIEEQTIGLVVDMVNEVSDIPEENVSPPPSVSGSAGSRYIHGMGKIGDDVKILLDVPSLLGEEELAAMTS